VRSDPTTDSAGGVPGSTYRLQLGPQLKFADAAQLADYLSELGITHAYLSPILAAGHGSTHGYDVVDHAHINPELGGPRGFATLRKALKAHGIGVVLDIVPNHMSVPVPESLNHALWAVLRDGAGSQYASWFDIDWDAGGGRVLMPVLDGSLPDNLANLSLENRPGLPPVLRYFDHRFPVAEGTETMPLAELVDAQHYRLADWRSASSDLNYRRFMDITTLIGLRVEDPAVFTATHEIVVDLAKTGMVQCLRIDHPDGLADPAGYLRALATATGSPWVVVEKILADAEPLPPDWNAAGTTGYETLTVLNELLVDAEGEPQLSRTYTELTGEPAEFGVVAEGGKRLIATEVLQTEVSRLVRLLAPAGSTGPGVADVAGADTLREAIVEVIAGLDVYRPFASSPRTIDALDRSAALATERHPEHRREIDAVRSHALRRGEFATRFAQTAAAVYAKGVEDTAFYRHARLLSLNEVGGDPGRFGIGLDDFHDFAATLQRQWPTAMTTLSTHDTKRGEDVRARLAVLSELPDEWDAAVRRWLPVGDKLGCPDEFTGYFFWQTIVGAWPLDAGRAARYMEKATREAKRATSWHSPDERYDRAVRDFVTAVFDEDGLLADIGMFVATIEPFAAANSLTQKLIQLTMPGIPDTYQGCELATFSLVDPDNRGPVDFDVRREALRSLLDDKLRVTATALRLRRKHPDWFAEYIPLHASGPAAGHVVAFARSAQLITVATRLSARLSRDGGWRATTLTLPPGTWVDALSGREHEGGDVLLPDLLRGSAVALLVPGVSVTS
jgi:(1->4)-alpha-D-glucan 1-alpha-D-glucosylmutase